jgi:hypothetical protein
MVENHNHTRVVAGNQALPVLATAESLVHLELAAAMRLLLEDAQRASARKILAAADTADARLQAALE